MNKITVIPHAYRTIIFGFLALTIPIGCRTKNLHDRPVSANAPSQPPENMTGTWVHVGRPGQVSEAPAKDGRLKFRTGRHWTLTRADPETGVVTEHFGGTYTLNGNEYVETQEYGDETWQKDNGKSFRFIVKVEGDTMTQIGVGNPWTEVWKRLH